MELLVRLRVLLARHPAIYWVVVGLAALQLTTAVVARLDRLDEARRSWTDTREVWVAAVDHLPGDPVVAEPRTLPLAAIPATALLEAPHGTVVQRVDAGSVLTGSDLGSDRLSMLPDGWQGVAVETGAPPLPLQAGDHLSVIVGPDIVAADAVVMSVSGGTAVVAVPASEAPAVAAASQDQALALTLRRP